MGGQALVLKFYAKSEMKNDRIRTLDKRVPYKNYFSVEEHDIQVPRFDGSLSNVMTRAIFVSGDAVSVLPYDPVRDRVMLIEQFRFGPHIRGDQNPWKLEAIAGRIDKGETPEQTVHRETAEETGITIQKLLPAIANYPAPGAVAEYMYSFVGLTDLPDNVVGVSGLDSEDEDIKSYLFSFDQAMGFLADGRVDTGPLVNSLLWLALHRDSIRKGA
ncbi:MAG: NUDIX domain-containing protein [Paracoccaceae bacterium]